MNAKVLPESLIVARGNDGDVHGWEGEMNANVVPEGLIEKACGIEGTRIQEDKELTAPSKIITEEVLDAAVTLTLLSENQQVLVKEQGTQTETSVEEKVFDLTEKNDFLTHQLQDYAFSFNIIEACELFIQVYHLG